MDNAPMNFGEDQMFKLIKTKKVYMQVVEQVRDLIRSGKLKPGDKLPPERILAERLGVSRPSIREGIVALEILGLVVSRGGKGNIINDVVDSSFLDQGFRHLEEEESPSELLEARKIIEVEVAGYAAQRAKREDVAAIRQSLDSMSNIVDHLSASKQYEKYVGFGCEFHTGIARATHNTVLLRMVAWLHENLKEDLWIRLQERGWGQPGRHQKYLKKHAEILAAIQDRDSDMARKRMHQHITHIQRDLFGRA